MPSAGYGLAVRNDGSILVAGSVGENGERDGALFLFGEDGLQDREFGDLGVLVTDDENDTVFYDVLVTEHIVAATGVTVSEDGKRKSLLITYTEENGGNSALFRQQAAESADDNVAAPPSVPGSSPSLTTDDNEEGTSSSLAATNDGGVVTVGASGAGDVSSASVSKYTVAGGVSGTSSGSAAGNVSVRTKEPLEVTRTTARVPGEILSTIVGTVTERGVVVSVDELPVLKSSESTTDDTATSATADDITASTTTDDFTTSTIDETAPSITDSTEAEFSPTEQVVLSVSTDENATCRYNKDFDEDYSEMGGVLSETAGTGHHVTLGQLAEGSYIYYIRCMDEQGNINSSGTKVDFDVTEDTAEDTTPPTITSATEKEFTDKEDVILSVTTNEKAHCFYADAYSTEIIETGDAMATSDGINHKANLGTLAKGDHTYYVACKDISDQENEMEFPKDIEVTVASLYKNSIFSEEQVASASPVQTGLTTALETVGDLFVSTAMAQDDTTDTTDITDTADTTDADTEVSDFLEEGTFTSGSGTGQFTTKPQT
ncbi:MAG: hypothetical protein D3906_11900, partial [Candidatus Electrothrix sp. AUS1_2]|nr:hypothetical protein [Candidatus Electrothrix sp. AUS1_2]